jgi:hypothetical protein
MVPMALQCEPGSDAAELAGPHPAGAWRTDTIIAEYRFNGLIHSLERALNERFDATLQRIYITVVDQYPMLFHAADGELATTAMAVEGELTGYYHLPDGVVTAPYLYEFLVHVPADITFAPQEMFDLLDLYRYAGRRPAIRRFSPPDVEVEIILYPGLAFVANEPVTIDPSFELGTG